MTKHIAHVVGARPSFMKAALVMRALASFSKDVNIKPAKLLS
jgi:UDP-N-acetylglucosamine 2-epimerase